MKRLTLSLLVVLTLSAALVTSVWASTGPVAVSLPGLTDGQTIGGKVALSAIAAAPEPIVAMEYFLDEALLAKVVLAPFTYEWDASQITPGIHILKVQATDRAGNTGAAEVRLNIVPPLALTLSAPDEIIPIGEQIKLNVSITNLNELAQVDLIVDNQVLSSAQTPPFKLVLDTRQVTAGAHRVTIRATDQQGNQAHASITLQFAAQAEDYNWAYPVLTLLLIAAAMAAGLAVWRTIVAMRHSSQRTCRVQLQNLGNVPTRYELLADDPADALQFRLLLNGVSLPQVVKTSTRSDTPAPTATSTQPAEVRQKGRIISQVAYSIGSILPGEAGDNLKAWAGKGFEADRHIQDAEYTKQQAEQLGSVAKTTPAPAPTAASTTPAATGISSVITPGAWYTAFFQPGDTATLNLIIKPSRPLQKQHYTFRVSSRAIDPTEAKALITNGNLLVEGASLTKYYVTFFIIAGITLTIVAAIGLLLANAG